MKEYDEVIMILLIIRCYNNYYTSGLYIAYAGVFINTLLDLRNATKQDIHSINRFMYILYPSLELKDTTGFTCPRLSYVQKDITGKQRNAITLMGVYEYLDFDVSLSVSYPPTDQPLALLICFR
jgi:hypothetical protein